MAQNIKPDTLLKNYWQNSEHFADFFNAVLFKGIQIIKAEDLLDVDTDESTVLEHRQYAESIQAARDNIKICKRGDGFEMELVMAGIENQEHIHYAMPLRIMGYDYGTYKKQYTDLSAKNKNSSEQMSEDEFLSHMRKSDRLIPVITVVIYYGEKPWDAAVSLHGLLRIPEQIVSFVNDYKIHLVEARENRLLLHNMENRDLFNLFAILLGSNNPWEKKELAIDYAKEHAVEKDVIMAVAGATNSKLSYSEFERKGETDMISVFQETWDEGKAEGKAEGIIETGYDCGLSREDILMRLQNRLDISIQKAQEYMEMFGKQRA